MSPEELAYFAGIVDGEGCIYISHANDRGNFNLMLRIGITNKEVIDWIQKRFGGGRYTQKKQKVNWKHCYIIHWSGIHAQDILKAVLPLLIIKKEQALNALAFPTIGYKNRMNVILHARQKDCYEQSRLLNKKGI